MMHFTVMGVAPQDIVSMVILTSKAVMPPISVVSKQSGRKKTETTVNVPDSAQFVNHEALGTA